VPGRSRTPRWRDWRVWFGVAVTVFFGWLALKDVDLAEVARTIARTDWILLFGISVPAYVMLLWLRALRWRHLTEPIQPMPRSALFRAVSVGFMANNLFPLRMGEVVRSWYLARETGTSAAAVFGTVILERVVDTVSLILLVCMVIAMRGDEDGVLARGAVLLLPVAVLPIVFLAVLKAKPERVLAWTRFLLRPIPRLAGFVERLLAQFEEGLGALRGGRHLLWIAFHSVLIWWVVSVLPILASFGALGLDLGSPARTVEAAWTTQAVVGVAVALPSAPGFFGIFHWACQLALVGFGVPSEEALAAGTLLHAVMWLTLTGIGLGVLWLRSTSLGDIDRAGDASESA